MLIVGDRAIGGTNIFAWWVLDRPIGRADRERVEEAIWAVMARDEWEYPDVEAEIESALDRLGYVYNYPGESPVIWMGEENPGPARPKDGLVRRLVALVKSREGTDPLLLEIIADLNLTKGELAAFATEYSEQFHTTPAAAYVGEPEREEGAEDMWWEGPSGNPRLEGERRALADRLCDMVRRDPRRDDPVLAALLSRLTIPEIEYYIEAYGESAY